MGSPEIGLPAVKPLTEAEMARVNEFTKSRLMGERVQGEVPVGAPTAAAPIQEPEFPAIVPKATADALKAKMGELKATIATAPPEAKAAAQEELTGLVKRIEDVYKGTPVETKPPDTPPAAEPTQPPAPKEPWEMTAAEFDASLKDKRRSQIEEWNKQGSKGFPPSTKINTVAERIALAEQAGYELPRDADVVNKIDYHKLNVEAALAAGKPVPPEVLKDYPDLAQEGREPYELGSGGPSTEAIVAGAKKIANLPYPKEVKEWTLQTFLPTAKSPQHLETAVDLGAELGAMNRRAEVTHNALKSTSKALDKLGIHDPNLPPEDNVGFQFASNMSTGKPQPTPALQNIDNRVRQEFDQRLKLLDEKGAPLPSEKVRENYFPGMWEKNSIRAFNQAIAEAIARGAIDPETFDPNTALPQVRIALKMRVNDLLATGEGSDSDALQYFSRRPMKGGESFRKQKVFNDWQVGIDYGLKPISNNPLDLVRMKLAELDRSIMMNGFLRMQEAKGNVINTTLSGVPMKVADRATFNPGEWTRLPDSEPYGKIWAREGGVLKLVGYRMFKKPVADILNNYLSQGLMSNPLYRGVMAVGNSLNQSQLGLGSLFHGGFTTIEAQINAGADLIQDIYGLVRGNRTVGQVAKTAAKWPIAMGTAPFKGGEILKEWRAPTISIPENVPVEQLPVDSKTRVALIAKAVELAGGRTTMEIGLRTNQQEKMLRDWFGGKKLKAAMRSPIALTELSMKPLMMAYVPRQKLAVFGEMAGRIIEQNPGKTMEELRGLFRERYNHVDATLGQVSYDRLFMKNAAKNALQMLIRAPGWTGGTIIEVGGSPVDAAKFIGEWAKSGKAPQDFPRKLAYVISLALSICGVNGLLTRLFTGENPHGMDFLAFRDHKNKRWMLPSYMKDIYSWYNAPVDTALYKTHPTISLAQELYRGKDYYGVQFRDHESTLFSKALDTGVHGIQAYEPFWMRGMKKAGEEEGSILQTLQKNPAKILAPEVGVMPAPRAYTATATDKIMDTYNENSGQPTRSPEDQELYKVRKRAGELVREGKRKEAVELIKPIQEKFHIPENKVVKWLIDSQEDPQVRRFKNMTQNVGGKDGLGWQLKALSVASEEELNKLAPITLHKIQTALDKNNTETLEKNRVALGAFRDRINEYKAKRLTK